jgi:hypothetical protein
MKQTDEENYNVDVEECPSMDSDEKTNRVDQESKVDDTQPHSNGEVTVHGGVKSKTGGGTDFSGMALDLMSPIYQWRIEDDDQSWAFHPSITNIKKEGDDYIKSIKSLSSVGNDEASHHILNSVWRKELQKKNKFDKSLYVPHQPIPSFSPSRHLQSHPQKNKKAKPKFSSYKSNVPNQIEKA